MLLVEKLKKIKDHEGVFWAVLTDLLKAFDCIPQNLVWGKSRFMILMKN